MSNAEDKDEGLGRPAGGGKMPTARGRKDNVKPYDRSSSSSLFARFCSNVKDYLVPSYFTYNLSGLNVQPKDDLSKTEGSNMKPDNSLGETSGFNATSENSLGEISGFNARSDNCLGAMRGLNTKPDDELSGNSDSRMNTICDQEKNNEGNRPKDIYQTAMSSAVPMESDSSIHSNFRRLPLESVRTTSGVDHSSGEQSTRYRLDGPTTSDNSGKHRQSLPLFEQDLNESECYDSSSIACITDKFVKRPATTFSDSNVSRSIVPPSSDNYLWSSERNNDARKQPAPSFDVSAFSQSMNQTLSGVSKITSATKLPISSRIDGESLFYAGQTTYGGASSVLRASRSDLSSSPYQRRETKTQQVNAKPSGALGNAGVTSSTSRRMLEAIQRGEDSRVSLRNLQSRNSVVDITSQSNASSTSVFHRNSAQFDSTVSKDSLLSNSVRAAPSASDVNRTSASPPGIALPSKSTYFNNPEFGRTTNVSEIIRERPQESGGKMKRAPKVQKHYSSRQDDDEDAVESDPLLRTIEPLPSININPGFLEAATSTVPSGFTFSMPQEVGTVGKTSSMPSVMDNKVAKSVSALINEDIQFRVPSDIGIANTKSSSSVSKSTLNAPAIASLHSVTPIPLFGSKSVSDQFSSSASVTQRTTVSDTGFFNAPETGSFKIGASSNLSNRSNFVSNESNLSMTNYPVAESNGSSNTTVSLFGSFFTSKSSSDERKKNSLHESKESLPNITEDGLSGPPLRDDTNTVSTTNSSIASTSNIDVVTNNPVSSTGKMTSVTKISSASTRDTNVNAHCANEIQAVVPLSELFKKSANVWTCDECYLSNKSDATVCVACDTARSGHVPPPAILSTVVQGAIQLTTNSGSDKLTGAGSRFSFSSLPKESATSDGQNVVAPGFRPSNADLFSSAIVGLISSSSNASSSDSDGITVGIVAKSSMFGSGSFDSGCVFGAPANNSSVTAHSFPNSLNTAPSSSMFDSNTSNTSPAFGLSSNGMFSSSNAKNLSFGVSSKTEDISAAVPVLSSGSVPTTSASGFNFSGFGGFSNNPVIATVGVGQSSTATPMISFPTTTTISSSSFPASSAAVMFGLTSTTSNSPKFNYVAPAAPLFGIPLSSSASTTVVPVFGTPSNTMATTPQFGAATPTTAVSAGTFSIATPGSSVPFFGIGAPPSSTPMFGLPTTTTTTNTFGAQAAQATEKAPMFGMNNSAPMFGQQSNVLTFGQQHVQQPTATSSAAPFIFGVSTTTTNSSSVFQMPPAVAMPFFGIQSSVASTPSGFGASVFSTPNFGAAKSDSFPSTVGFGAPTPNVPFGTSQGMGSVIPSFGATAGAKSMFGALSASNGQTGVVPTFGAVAPTNGPSFSFGNGMQNSQTAPSPFTFGGGSSGNQLNNSSKIIGSGHTSKRGLDDGSSNGANTAKRTSDMFGNQIVNTNPFPFGSGQQQAAPANVWNQQHPSAATNNNSTAFSTTLPSAGFNFAAAASQFNFPAAPTNNPGGVFQFGGVANQQAALNPFGNASNTAQNTFNNANTSNPFDVAPSNSTRVIKKAVRKTVKR